VIAKVGQFCEIKPKIRAMNKDDVVLVTGASGFIASWVVAYALETGAKVRGTVRDPNNAAKTRHLTSLPGASERLELVALDLTTTKTEDFARVVAGCTLVAHTASPNPSQSPKDENELIRPAVEGTVGILRACKESSSIRAIVVTSSIVSVSEGKAQKGKALYTESDWSDVEADCGMYAKSKTLAERAAWAYFEETKPEWTLCTINPAFVG
jgi:nucleoside-diphosphate-sugar epimerase